MARLKEYYRDNVVQELQKGLGFANTMQVPRIAKITVNMGVGEAVADKKAMDGALSDLTAITGQKPAITRSRKSIASFKLRAGQQVGCRVTLRGERMYEFLDRLINVAMPRFPRRFGARVRRSRQLHARRQGTDHLPRDRLRQDRRNPGHGHHDYHDGAERPGRTGAARGLQLPVPQVRVGKWRRQA
jgi:hypothetical protein